MYISRCPQQPSPRQPTMLLRELFRMQRLPCSIKTSSRKHCQVQRIIYQFLRMQPHIAVQTAKLNFRLSKAFSKLRGNSLNGPLLTILRRHAKVHHKPFACNVEGCHWRFPTLKDLKRHKGSLHKDLASGPRQTYNCAFCDYVSDRKDNLKRHSAARHLQHQNVLSERVIAMNTA